MSRLWSIAGPSTSGRLGTVQRVAPARWGPCRPLAATYPPAAAPAPFPTALREIDDKLSWRPLQLDPAGYFIIKLDREGGRIVAEHYSNAINDKGLAVDEESGQVIGCRGGSVRLPRRVFSGRTAKELAVAVLEPQAGEQGAEQAGQGGEGQRAHALPWISRLEHAGYLGREFVRAEAALLSGAEYVQD